MHADSPPLYVAAKNPFVGWSARTKVDHRSNTVRDGLLSLRRMQTTMTTVIMAKPQPDKILGFMPLKKT